jgi:hypothetical protein
LGEKWATLAWFSKDLFMDAVKHRWLMWFWVKRGRVGDASNFTYTKCKCVGNSFRKWGGIGFGGVYWFVNDVWWVSGIVGRPNANTNALLVSGGDFEFGVSYKCVKGLVPADEEPRVVDKFKG